MEIVQLVLPLVGVVLGAVLSGVGGYLKHRNERKRVIARALSDLLEIRHRFVGVDAIFQETKKHTHVPADAAVMLREFFGKMLEIDDETQKRYRDALDALAGIDPVLAFRLRSKDQVPNLIRSIKDAALRYGASSAEVSQVEPILREFAVPALNDAVLELAGYHSSRTKQEVEKLVSRVFEFPPEILAKLKAPQGYPVPPAQTASSPCPAGWTA
jgi:hypothetical protein